MTGGNYSRAKGYRFEQKVKHLLTNQGFFCVRQGRSVFPDLVAINKKTYLIECKVNKYISKQEREVLLDYEKKYNIIPLIAYNNNGKVEFCSLEYKKKSIIKKN